MKFFLIVFLALSSLLAQNSTLLPTSQHFSDYEKIAIPFDIEKLKTVWRQRIETIRTQGVIPLTDIESSFNPGKFNLIDYAKMMDEYGVALIAFSPEIGDNAYEDDAKIWCHLAQVRYSNRAKHYTPAYVRTLLERYPNLYFDLAFGDMHSVYKPSLEYHATIWDRETRGLKQAWAQLIEDYPYRFLIAFDIGGDRHDDLPEKIKVSRDILKSLSPQTQEIVAYKAFWK